jgi:hypothetical protein
MTEPRLPGIHPRLQPSLAWVEIRTKKLTSSVWLTDNSRSDVKKNHPMPDDTPHWLRTAITLVRPINRSFPRHSVTHPSFPNARSKDCRGPDCYWLIASIIHPRFQLRVSRSRFRLSLAWVESGFSARHSISIQSPSSGFIFRGVSFRDFLRRSIVDRKRHHFRHKKFASRNIGETVPYFFPS